MRPCDERKCFNEWSRIEAARQAVLWLSMSCWINDQPATGFAGGGSFRRWSFRRWSFRRWFVQRPQGPQGPESVFPNSESILNAGRWLVIPTTPSDDTNSLGCFFSKRPKSVSGATRAFRLPNGASRRLDHHRSSLLKARVTDRLRSPDHPGYRPARWSCRWPERRAEPGYWLPPRRLAPELLPDGRR